MLARLTPRRLLAQLHTPLALRRVLPRPIRGFVPHAALTLGMAVLAALGVGAGTAPMRAGGEVAGGAGGTRGGSAVQFSASGMLASLIDVLAGKPDQAHAEPPVVRMTRVLPGPEAARAIGRELRPGTEMALVVVRTSDRSAASETSAAAPIRLGEGWGSTCTNAVFVTPDGDAAPENVETLLARPLLTPLALPTLPVRVIN